MRNMLGRLPLVALALALTQDAGAGARGESIVVEDGAGICGPALERFVGFLEEELGHNEEHDDDEHDEHDHRRVLAGGHDDEDDHDDDHEEAVLQVGACGAELFTVLFEGELLNLNLTEHVVDTCVNASGTCEMTVCEGDELVLVEYAVCCSDVTVSSPVSMECHVDEVAEFVVDEHDEEYGDVVVDALAWANALSAVLITSLLSLSGIAQVWCCKSKLNTSVLNDCTALAIGVLLATVFVHLLPEAAETVGFGWELGTCFLAGIVCALFIQFGSSMLGVGHEHTPEDLQINARRGQPSTKLDIDVESDKGAPVEVDYSLVTNVVIGDGIHNTADGMIIGIAFATCGESSLGWITTLAVVAHELPQEMIDFVVLVRAGLSFRMALALNFCSSLTSFIGVVLALALAGNISENTQALILAFGAGFLAYIALAELVPHIIHLDDNRRKLFRMFLVVLGACFIGVLGLLHTHCGDDHSDHDDHEDH